MSWFLLVVLALAGVILITLEIVVIPGFITGICGLGMLAVSVWQTFECKGNVAGGIMVLASIAVFIILLTVFMKTKTWRFFSLNEKVDSKVNTIDKSSIAVGTVGTTVSRCAPSGKALLNGQIEEVHSQGDFIDENRAVEVIDIDGYKITVKEVKAQ